MRETEQQRRRERASFSSWIVAVLLVNCPVSKSWRVGSEDHCRSPWRQPVSQASLHHYWISPRWKATRPVGGLPRIRTSFNAQISTGRTPVVRTSGSNGDSCDDSLPFRFNYTIRDCAYGELNQVANIIMSSFYDSSTHSASPWKQLYRLGELNRLQQGYPHPGDARREHHRVLVAVLSAADECRGRKGTSLAPPPTIIGYCDVDGRAPNQATGFKYNPRPYLSDLCTDPRYRRNGVAKALVRMCEEYCVTVLERSHVYIRVEAKNAAAVALYQGMGYQIIPDIDPDRVDIVTTRSTPSLETKQKDEILLLRKDLRTMSSGETLELVPNVHSVSKLQKKHSDNCAIKQEDPRPINAL